MKLKDKVIVVTGGASSIGFALCQRFVREKAKVVISDKDTIMAIEKAGEIGAIAIPADVCQEKEIKNLINVTNDLHGRIDMFVSSVRLKEKGGEETTARKWKQSFDINLMAHVYAAKFVLPQMLERGNGYLLNVISPLDFQSASFTASEYAAIGFSEWLAAKYAEFGVKVSVLCPPPLAKINLNEYEKITEIAIQAITENRFLISTNHENLHFFNSNNY